VNSRVRIALVLASIALIVALIVAGVFLFHRRQVRARAREVFSPAVWRVCGIWSGTGSKVKASQMWPDSVFLDWSKEGRPNVLLTVTLWSTDTVAVTGEHYPYLTNDRFELWLTGAAKQTSNSSTGAGPDLTLILDNGGFGPNAYIPTMWIEVAHPRQVYSTHSPEDGYFQEGFTVSVPMQCSSLLEAGSVRVDTRMRWRMVVFGVSEFMPG
jgi:hypothetical protein